MKSSLKQGDAKLIGSPLDEVVQVLHWPSRDPIGEERFFREFSRGMTEEEVKELVREGAGNLFSFVRNDGVNSVDYLGLRKLGVFTGSIWVRCCDDCPELLDNYRYIPEDGAVELKRFDKVDGGYTVDALYLPGVAYKINDLGQINISCDCDEGTVELNRWRGLGQTEWKAGDPPPGGVGWPGGPNAIPPYPTTPPN